MKMSVLCAVALLAMTGMAAADPWKDESGKGMKGKWRESYGASDRGFERKRARTAIPRGHLPPPGECRNWYRGLSPGHQPPPYRC
jgi:hypothetical protein